MIITLKEAEEKYKKNLITKEKFDEMFDEMLDEYGPIKIGNLEYNASNVLKQIDPVAYKTWKNDYADSLISDGYIIEEYFDFDSYIKYLEEQGYKVIEDDELNEFEDNEFTNNNNNIDNKTEHKQKLKNNLKLK